MPTEIAGKSEIAWNQVVWTRRTPQTSMNRFMPAMASSASQPSRSRGKPRSTDGRTWTLMCSRSR